MTDEENSLHFTTLVHHTRATFFRCTSPDKYDYYCAVSIFKKLYTNPEESYTNPPLLIHTMCELIQTYRCLLINV